MKVALVILHADPARGGAERYTVDLADALAGAGVDVSVLASSFGPGGPPQWRAVPLDARGLGRLAGYERFLSSVESHISNENYDLVHAMLPVLRCDLYHPHAGLAVAAVAQGHLRHRSPLARAGSWLGNRINRKRRRFASVERQLLVSANPPRVLCLSEVIKSEVRRWHSLPENRLEKLFNAVDLQRFDPAASADAGMALRRNLPFAEESVVALMVAQDLVRKGMGETIAAMGHCDRRLHVVVVGRENPAPWRRRVAQAGVAERIHFAGATRDVRPFYAAADFLLLPTHHDPCSLVVLEALAMGLPVLTTAANGASEVMRDGVEGFVMKDPGDIAALAAAMQRMADAETRRRMRQACLALRPALSYERHLRMVMQIYERVSAERCPRPHSG